MTRGGRALTVAILALVEVTLVAAIVIVAAGLEFANVGGWEGRVPGGRLAIVGGGVLLLIIAAAVMTVLVSD